MERPVFTYYNNVLCVEGGWLYNAKIISKSYYKKLKRNGILKAMNRACKGNPAKIAYESIPPKYKAIIIEREGNPYKQATLPNPLEKIIKRDSKAAQYFSNYLTPKGNNLPIKRQIEYTTNAEILNAMQVLVNKRNRLSASTKGKVGDMWQQVADYVKGLNPDKYRHSLPTSWRRLRDDKFKPYIKYRYESLIHPNYGNDSARVVTARFENLIISLYCMPEKPFATTVLDDYLQFMGEAFDLVDLKTGELFDRTDFRNEDGTPIIVSNSTIWNILKNPKNQPVIAKHRSDALEFQKNHSPHHHRHAPHYSLSKISMDDRDLPRKLPNGKRLKVYYAYDILSGCVVGVSYARQKNTKLFIDCMRNMFQFLHNNNFGVPMEVEVEHHLVNQFKNDLMQAGNVFPFVRWCLAGNSQEKWAETGNRIKKLGFEKRYQQGIGRFYAKLEAHRTTEQKVFDAENDTYKFKSYSEEQLIADDLWTIEQLNNSLHPNQSKFKGMTRLEVLKYHLNPDITPLNPSLIARYIGDKTQTSIVRNQYFSVKRQKYIIPSVDVLDNLSPNNYTVQAYYIPKQDKTIDKVFIYQNDLFIAECLPLEEYNTATAEWTDKDEYIKQQQSDFVKSFRTKVKENSEKVSRLKKLPKIETPKSVEIVEDKNISKEDKLAELLKNYQNEDIKKQALENL